MNHFPHVSSLQPEALPVVQPVDWPALIERLSEPFPESEVKWRVGKTNKDKTKILKFAYAEPRAYEDRLDQVCPGAWHVTFEPWGENRIICCLTIHGITRSSTGEQTTSSNNAGTIAEAQAFKRACSKFGLGRYLYHLSTGWEPCDAPVTSHRNGGVLAQRKHLRAEVQPHREALIGPERAKAMALALSNVGVAIDQQLQFVQYTIGLSITRLSALTESQALDIWKAAKDLPHSAHQ